MPSLTGFIILKQEVERKLKVDGLVQRFYILYNLYRLILKMFISQNLAENKLHTAGAVALKEFLREHPTLQTLSLSGKSNKHIMQV